MDISRKWMQTNCSENFKESDMQIKGTNERVIFFSEEDDSGKVCKEMDGSCNVT